MIQLLVSAALADYGPRLDAAVEAARRIVKPDVVVVPCTRFDWKKIMREQGSWEGAYRWAARTFDAVLLVEPAGGTLSRGVYQIAEEFRRAGKRVVVQRGEKLVLVKELRLTGSDDWKANWGTVAA